MEPEVVFSQGSDDIALKSRRNHDRRAVFQGMVVAVEHRVSFPFFNSYELICIIVYSRADVFQHFTCLPGIRDPKEMGCEAEQLSGRIGKPAVP